MRFPLQQLGHRESDYERPTMKWECGWRREGRSCEAGPDACGNCQAARQSVCEPRQQGGNWVCTRSPMFGGPCAEGPDRDGNCCHPRPAQPVCKPRLKLRGRRGRFVKIIAGLTLAVLLLLLLAPGSYDNLSPGPLSSAHAGLRPEAAGKPNQCSLCHVAADARHAFGALLTAVRPGDPLANSQRCASCHFTDEQLADRDIFKVHSTPPSRLEPATRRAQDRAAGRADQPGPGASPGLDLALARLLGSPAGQPDAELACATCHVEHHGQTLSLAAMSDAACQVCHTDAFARFGRGHPEFHLGPQPAGLNFNHLEHQRREPEAFNCASCHEVAPDRLGGVVSFRGFDQSCATCHAEDFRPLALPMPIVQLPALEPDADWWNPQATLDPDASLPPTMLLLLAGDPAVRPELSQLVDAQGDLTAVTSLRLTQEDEDTLAEAIRRLLIDLSADDPAGLRQRLASALNLPADHPHVVRLARELRPAREAVFLFAFDHLEALELDEAVADELPAFTATLPDAAGPPAVQYLFADAQQTADHDQLIARAAHADPLIVALLDALGESARQPDAPASPDKPSRHLAADLLKTSARQWETSCLSCHSPGDDAQGLPRIVWQSPPRSLGFRKFDHATHVPRTHPPAELADLARHATAQTPAAASPTATQGRPAPPDDDPARQLATHHPDQAACLSCHGFATPTTASGSPSGSAPRSDPPSSGLQPVAVASCVDCHSPHQPAGDACLTCHDYHHQRPLLRGLPHLRATAD